MDMELKTTDDSEYIEIHDETGQIGALFHAEEGWTAELSGFKYVIHKQTAHFPTAAEAFDAAWPLYEELLEQRRTAERFHRNQPTRFISTPMGGQPKK